MEHHAPPSVRELLLPAINFAIYLFIIVRRGKGPLIEFFRQRAARLSEALAAGARARAKAEELRAQVNRDRENLPQVRAELRAELLAVATRERAKILALARDTADRIRVDARVLADQELAQARSVLRGETVGEALRRAATILRGAITTDDQRRLVREFMSHPGASQ